MLLLQLVHNFIVVFDCFVSAKLPMNCVLCSPSFLFDFSRVLSWQLFLKLLLRQILRFVL